MTRKVKVVWPIRKVVGRREHPDSIKFYKTSDLLECGHELQGYFLPRDERECPHCFLIKRSIDGL